MSVQCRKNCQYILLRKRRDSIDGENGCLCHTGYQDIVPLTKAAAMQSSKFESTPLKPLN
jgi:hypothetical protein